MAPRDDRLPKFYKTGAALFVASLVYYFIEYIFWSTFLGCLVYTAYVYLGPNAPKTIDPVGKAILITGCDSGFGRELAIRAHRLGFTVFAGCLSTNTEGPRELECTYEERMHVLKMDVTSDVEVKNTVKYVSDRCRSTGLWAVVNNSGLDGGGPVEISSMRFYREICEVNLFGTIRVTKAFLPLVRLAKGRIINMSSERGLLARGDNSTYCISKYGVEAFSDSLRQEMKPFGVQVSIIEPGHFGGATAILQERNVEMFRKRLTDGYEEAEPEVKNAYPQNIVEQFVKGKYDAVNNSNMSIEPVMETLERQLVQEQVDTRCLIGGTNGVVDMRVVCIYLKPFLPVLAFDYLLRLLRV